MRYCTHCGHIIDEYDFDRDDYNCGVCGAILSEDDMTALKYAELSEQEKDEYENQLLNSIKNSAGFDEGCFRCHCSMDDGYFWKGFRLDKYAQFISSEALEFFTEQRKKNEPFKPFPPIDIEKAREAASDAYRELEKIKSGYYTNRVVEPVNIPKCPTCQSTNIEKISLTQKAVGGALFGLFSSNVRKTMHCKNCGYKW